MLVVRAAVLTYSMLDEASTKFQPTLGFGLRPNRINSLVTLFHTPHKARQRPNGDRITMHSEAPRLELSRMNRLCMRGSPRCG